MAATKKPPAKAAPSQLPAKINKDLPVVDPPQAIIKSPADLAIMARFVAESSFYPRLNDVAKAAVVIETGRELGIQMMMACQLIHPIATNDGIKVVIESKLLAMIALQNGVRWKIVQKDPTACTLEFYSLKDKTLPTHKETFTFKDAIRAGLSGKKNWQWYPEEMCYNRCLKKGLTVFDPRIGGGFYTLEEAVDFEPIDDNTVADELAAEVMPDTETAPDQNAAQTRGEATSPPPRTTEDHKEAEELGLGQAPEQRQRKEQQGDAPDEIDHDFMPYNDEPTPDELKPGTRDLAPPGPIDPVILIYKEVILDYFKIQQMDKIPRDLYPDFKEWLAVFQTSRSPTRNFVARNQFGAWSIEKGSKADLKILTDNLNWTMRHFFEHCFNILKLPKVGIYDNPALTTEQD